MNANPSRPTLPSNDADSACGPWEGRGWRYWPILPLVFLGGFLLIVAVAWGLGAFRGWGGPAPYFWPIFPLGFFFLFVVLFVVVLFVLFFLFVLVVFGEHGEVHRMSLRHFEFDLTLGTAHDLAFLDFVFVQIDLRVAFRAFGHGNHPSSLAPAYEGVLYNARVKDSRGG